MAKLTKTAEPQNIFGAEVTLSSEIPMYLTTKIKERREQLNKDIQAIQEDAKRKQQAASHDYNELVMAWMQGLLSTKGEIPEDAVVWVSDDGTVVEVIDREIYNGLKNSPTNLKSV